MCLCNRERGRENRTEKVGCVLLEASWTCDVAIASGDLRIPSGSTFLLFRDPFLSLFEFVTFVGGTFHYLSEFMAGDFERCCQFEKLFVLLPHLIDGVSWYRCLSLKSLLLHIFKIFLYCLLESSIARKKFSATLMHDNFLFFPSPEAFRIFYSRSLF